MFKQTSAIEQHILHMPTDNNNTNSIHGSANKTDLKRLGQLPGIANRREDGDPGVVVTLIACRTGAHGLARRSGSPASKKENVSSLSAREDSVLWVLP